VSDADAPRRWVIACILERARARAPVIAAQPRGIERVTLALVVP
jgi:hypothetical protein